MDFSSGIPDSLLCLCQDKPNTTAKKGGVLTVVNTQIKGGAQAVHCLGTGALRGVRVMYHSHSSNFWFDVDSKSPGKAHYSGHIPQLQPTEFKRELIFEEEKDDCPKRIRID